MNHIYATLFTASALFLAGPGTAQAQGLAAKAPQHSLQTAHPTSMLASTNNSLRGGGAPFNDECSGAVNESLAIGSTLTFSGDNTGATEDGGTGFIIVWHAFTTTECADIAINYCVPGFVFENFLVNLSVQCPDFVADVLTGAEDGCTVSFVGLPAGVYYVPVLVDPADTPVGAYTIEVSATACAEAPVNDGCASPVDLATGSTINFSGTTAGATSTGDFIPGSELDGEAPTVWHAFTTTGCTNVTVSYCGTASVFSNVWVFLAPSCPAGDDYIATANYENTSCSDGNYTLVYDYLPAGTYHLPVMFDAGAANGPYTITVTAEACAPGYCIPSSANGPNDGDFIANVTLGSINNTTGGVNAYEDYTSQTTTLAQGGSYILSITSGDYGQDVYAAWIDYNVDTTFQVSEKLGEFSASAAGEVVTLPFTVPVDAMVGTTRLRVRGAYNETGMEPCSSYSYSETEDYTVEIELGSGVHEYQASNLAIYPNPTTGDVTVSGADLSGNVQFELMDMTGRVVYRHQQSMSANEPVTLPLNGKLAQGTYTLRLINPNGISSRPVMVK